MSADGGDIKGLLQDCEVALSWVLSSALSLFSGDFLYYTNKTHDTVAAGGDDTDTNTGGGTGEGLFEEIEDGGIIGVSPILLLLHMLLAAYLSPPI